MVLVEIIHKLCNTKLRLAKTTSSLKYFQSSVRVTPVAVCFLLHDKKGERER